MTYPSLHMEHVSNIGNVLYCVTFEQQEMHHDDGDDIMCLSLFSMTHELIILSN
jgi:hypothetical protein